MKMRFSFAILLFWVVVYVCGDGLVRGETVLKKGSVTAGLIKELGIGPYEGVKSLPSSEAEASVGTVVKSSQTIHQASTIPVNVERGVVVQTSGEQPVVTENPLILDTSTSDPFLEDAGSVPTTSSLGESGTGDVSAPMSLDFPATENVLTEAPSDATPETPSEVPSEKSDISGTQTVENLSALDEQSAFPGQPGPVAEMSLPPETLPVQVQVPEPVAEPAQVPKVESGLGQPTEMNLAPVSQSAVSSPSELKPADVISAGSHGQEEMLLNSSSVEGSGKPGEASLEGVQAAGLKIQKTAPEEIQVGEVSSWTISVRNESQVSAVGVQIHDVIPQGTQLVRTDPPAHVSPKGEITWTVGTMPAGMMALVKLELMPLREGEIGSIASVTASTEASAKTVSTRPLLKVETFGEAEVLMGNETELSIVVSNPGTGTTKNVVLSETVPSELQFEGGAELRYKVGNLAPGESKTVKLPLTAVRPGKFENKIIAKSSANLQVESLLSMAVTAPALKLEVQGPSKRFLEKEGTFRLILTNVGTAAARNVEIKADVPNGWNFVSANNFGAYQKERQAVVWKLEELGPGAVAETELLLLPQEIGSFVMGFSANADTCQPVNGTKALSVEGIAALMFQVVDSNDPIQVGEDTKYTVEVINQGSKQAENVQIYVTVPAGLQIVSSEEETRVSNSAEGKVLIFSPIPSLGPKAAKVYRFTLRGVASGDQRVVVKLSSREFPTPIVKEESTRVFAE